jgi:hypothetical protein
MPVLLRFTEHPCLTSHAPQPKGAVRSHMHMDCLDSLRTLSRGAVRRTGRRELRRSRALAIENMTHQAASCQDAQSGTRTTRSGINPAQNRLGHAFRLLWHFSSPPMLPQERKRL